MAKSCGKHNYRVQRRGVCRLNIKTRRNSLNKLVILIALQFRYTFYILGDPGADSGDEGKSKRAEKYIWNEEK